MKTVQKKSASPSTQAFIEIDSIKENYVMLKGGYAATIIEVQSTNFALMSVDEQHVKLLAYASLLNSLSFPIQILIRSKRIDITSYIASINDMANHIPFLGIEQQQQQKISSFVLKYKGFIEELTKVNTVLDKKFYIVVPYTTLEQGAKGALAKNDTFEQAKANLKIKADSLILQIQRLSLRAKLLNESELVKLFYEIFNNQATKEDILKTLQPVIKGGQS